MYKIKKKNGTIASLIIGIIILIYGILLSVIASITMPEILQIIIIVLYCFLGILLLPGILFKFQIIIYDYLNKYVDIIYSKMSYEYIPVFLNTEGLNKSAFKLDSKRNYMAKLENDGKITLKIEDANNNEVFEEQTSDYYWFLKMFRFEK